MNQTIARGIAVAMLGLIPATLVAEPVSFWIGNLKNPNLLIRKSAARKLAELRDLRALDPLIEGLNDPEPEVRTTVVKALQRIGDLRAVGPLVGVSKKDDDYYVRHVATVAIGKIKRYQERLEEKEKKKKPRADDPREPEDDYD